MSHRERKSEREKGVSEWRKRQKNRMLMTETKEMKFFFLSFCTLFIYSQYLKLLFSFPSRFMTWHGSVKFSLIAVSPENSPFTTFCTSKKSEKNEEGNFPPFMWSTDEMRRGEVYWLTKGSNFCNFIHHKWALQMYIIFYSYSVVEHLRIFQ